MKTILETRLEENLVSNQGEWPYQMVQTVFIGNRFDAIRRVMTPQVL